MAKDAIQVVVEFLSKGVEGILQSLNKVQNAMTNFAFMGAKFDDKTGKMTRSLTTFRMEMLSVMFFGMMLQKTFLGMVNPTLQVLGVFDLLGVLIQSFLLPVLLPLLPYFLALFEAMMGLPEPVKALLGIFIILGALVGTFLFLLGTFTLGWSGLVATFGTVASAGGIVTGGLTGIMAVLSAFALPILAIIAVLALLWVAWEFNLGNIRGIAEVVLDLIGNLFKGLGEIVGGVMKIIEGILTLDAEKIFIGFQELIRGVVDIIKSMFIELPVAIAKSIILFVSDIWNRLHDFEGRLLSFGANMIINIAKGIVNGIVSIGSSLVDAIWNIIPEPLRGWLKGGLNVAGNIVSGVGNFVSNLKIPGFETGGVMPYTGLAYLHQGETITPAGETNYYPTAITISNPVISSSYDVRNLARELNDYWESGRRTSR